MRPVLVIDDDRDIREMVAMLLRLRGFAVELAADGQEALDRLRAGVQPSVVLLDMMMPGMDGAQLLAILRKDARWSTLPVVLLSGDTSANDRLGGLRIEGFLRKPVEMLELIAVATQYCRAVPEAERTP